MKKSFQKVISLVLAIAMLLGASAFAKVHISKAETGKVETKSESTNRPGIEKWLDEHRPINGGYYRVWNDEASLNLPKWKSHYPDSDKRRELTKMGDVPSEVDLVLAFYDNNLGNVPEETMKQYVAKLHEKGQKVVGSIFAHILYDDIEYNLKNQELSKKIEEEYKDYIETNYQKGRKVLSFRDNEEDNKKRAEFILKYYMNIYNFDGLDIDMEKTGDEFKGKEKHYNNVLEILSQHVGPKSNSDKLFIYDTTRSAFHPAFKEHSDKFDLVLIQMYGNRAEYRNTEDYKNSIDFKGNSEYFENEGLTLFETFSSLIPAEKIMIGFSFYEENSYGTKTIPTAVHNNRWYDIPTTDKKVEKLINSDGSFNTRGYFVEGGFEESRAARYAKWQHEFGLKGGVFSYAIDRDGVAHPTKDEAQQMYNEYSKFTTNGEDIDIEQWVNAGRPGKSPSDDLYSSTYEYSKQLKQILKESNDYKTIDHEDFKDEALRKQIIAKVSKYKGNIERFNGDLVLDDPNIKDLTGLNKLKNVKSVSLKGLKNLEVLDLSNMRLEVLDIDKPEEMTSLKKVDLSNNRLDLSKNTHNRKVLEALYESVENKDKNSFKFEEQDILGYYPKEIEPKTIKLEVKENETFDLKNLLTKTVTAQGTDISDKEKVDELKAEKVFERTYIKSSVEYEKIKKDYNNFTFKVKNSENEVISDMKLSLAKEETYFVEIYQDQDKKYDVKVVVGREKQLLENLALKAKIKYNNTANPALFDGDLTQKALLTFNAPVSYIIDIGDNAQVSMIRLYNSSYVDKDKTPSQNDLETVRFEVLKPDVEITNRNEYSKLNDDSNWQLVHTMSKAEAVYQSQITPTSGRYWRINFDTVRDGKTAYPYATELQLLGQRFEIKDKYDVAVVDLVKDFGKAITLEDIKSAITVKESEKNVDFEVSLDKDQTLPNGQESGKSQVKVVVKFPDESTKVVDVNITINEKPDLKYEDLQTIIKKAEETKETQAYKNNRDDAKDKFDKVIEEAKTLIEKAANQEEITSMTEKVKKAIADLQQAFELIYKTKYVAFSEVKNPDYDLEFKKTKVTQEGKDGTFSEDGKITLGQDEIIVVGNLSKGVEIHNTLPRVIVKDESIPSGKFEEVKGEDRITRVDLVYKVDEKTGELLYPYTKEVVVKEGKPGQIKIGAGKVQYYDYVRDVEENEILVKTDHELELGKQKIEQGQVGIKETRYLVEVKDGIEISRNLDKEYEKTIQERKDTVITIGVSTKVQDDKIKQLEESKKALEDKLIGLEKNVISKEELNIFKQKNTDLEKEIVQLKEQIKSLKEDYEAKISKINENTQNLTKEMKDLSIKKDKLEAELNEKTNKIKALEMKIKDLFNSESKKPSGEAPNHKISIKKINKTIAEISDKLEEILKSKLPYNYKILDISVYNNEGKKVSELKEKISVEISLNDLGFTREQIKTLEIYSNHKNAEGEFELIQITDFEVKEGKIIFASDKFSDFVFVVGSKDEPKANDEDKKPEEGINTDDGKKVQKPEETPKTNKGEKSKGTEEQSKTQAPKKSEKTEKVETSKKTNNVVYVNNNSNNSPKTGDKGILFEMLLLTFTLGVFAIIWKSRKRLGS